MPVKVLDAKWTIEAAAAEARIRAYCGMNTGQGEGGSALGVRDGAEVSGEELERRAKAKAYIEDCTLAHEPSRCVVVFTRDDVPGFFKCWHLAIFGLGDSGFQFIEERTVKAWCLAVFGQDMPYVRRVSVKGDPGGASKEYHFVVEVKDWLEKEPRVVVPGSEGSALPGKVVPM